VAPAAVDPKHSVFLEGNWSAVIFDSFTTKPAENMVYSFHMYSFSGRNLDQDLASYVALARAQQVPLWVGEYGEDSADWLAMWTHTYASTPEIVGWTAWTWKRSPTGNPVSESSRPRRHGSR
jgi:hypothetical protein